MNYPSRLRLMVVALVATLLLVVPLQGQEALPAQVDTGFRADQHGWSIQNLAGTDNRTRGGICYGMARMAAVSFNNPELTAKQGLYQQTQKMGTSASQQYALEVHRGVERAARLPRFLGQADRFAPGQPAPNFDSIQRTMAASNQPQVLVLQSSVSPDRPATTQGVPGHTLVLTGYQEQGQKVIFNVYDPNRPHDPAKPVTTTLEYDKARKSFRVLANGKHVYTKYDQALHDRDDRQQTVIKRAQEVARRVQAEGIRPSPPNTGTYREMAEKDRALTPGQTRAERMQGVQRVSPIKGGFGGVILGNEPSQAPPLKDARFVIDADQVKIVVRVAGQAGEAVFDNLTITDLWSAYQFLHPGPELRQMGAERADLGLVGIAKNNMRHDGSWDFGIHPAIANTFLGLDAMRMDMVITLDDPRLPALPRGWVTYRWYDEAAVISVKDGTVHVRALTPPHDILMRVRLWGAEKPVAFDTNPYVEALFERFDGLQQIERFARAVAVLSWLDRAGKLPPLPAQLQPLKLSLPPRCELVDVAYDGARILTDSLTKLDQPDPYIRGAYRKVHQVFLEAGKEYLIDLSSPDFDPFLRLGGPDGVFLAEDDDSGGNYTARILFAPSKTGAYMLVVTSYKSGATGRYFLKVWEGQAAAGHSLLQAYGALSLNDPLDAVRPQSHHKVHTFRLHQGRTYQIDLLAKFDAYVRVEDGDRTQLAWDDDGGEGSNARLLFTPRRTADYRIIATSFGNVTGGYVLSIRQK